MKCISVPPPDTRFSAVMSDNAVVILRRHGNLAAPRLVLSHGNGCAINGYFPYWRKLITDFEVVVFDFRNSGVNPVDDGADGYARFLEDLTDIYDAIDREFGSKLQIGVFHSMSARANLKLALDGHSRLDGLLVFDPPMVPPTGHELFPMMLEEERMLCR